MSAYFPKHVMNLVHISYDDRYRSKVSYSNTPTHAYYLKVKVTDLEILKYHIKDLVFSKTYDGFGSNLVRCLWFLEYSKSYTQMVYWYRMPCKILEFLLSFSNYSCFYLPLAGGSWTLIWHLLNLHCAQSVIISCLHWRRYIISK